MKKKYFWFSFILVAFVLTAHSTWAYFKDQKNVTTIFASSVTSGDTTLSITNNDHIYNLERGTETDITKTITLTKGTSLPWDKDSVNLEFDTPICIVNKQEMKLSNLFSTYYIREIERTSVNDTQATFKVTVNYSVDQFNDLQLRLGVDDILFHVRGIAKSKNGKDISTTWDWLKIKTISWNWPVSSEFKNTHVRDWTKSDKPIIDASEYHTPMYYGPSVINDETKPHSKNVFPSLRFVNDNVTQLMSGSQLNYQTQLEVAKEKYPYEISYVDEDDNYTLIRGPIYFVPGKGFVSAYYMTWQGEVNDYGARVNWGEGGNKIFKRLYMYDGKYYSIAESNFDQLEVWVNGRRNYRYVYTYKLYPVDSIILSYVNGSDNRFVIQEENKLVANYNDYNGQFKANQIVYDPIYATHNLKGDESNSYEEYFYHMYRRIYYRIMLDNQEVAQNYKW